MIRIENLTLGYSGKPVVSVPRFALGAGEHCLLLGDSGSGKTTLLYAIAGLLKPLSGTLKVAGADITSLSASALDKFRGQHLGFIFQTLRMVEALTVFDNLLLVQYAAGLVQDKARAATLLGKLGIGDKQRSHPSQLSQGQAQRAAIARAAVTSPKLILCDEPTSALDDKSAANVVRLLLEVAQSTNASLVIATHDSRIKPHFPQVLNVGGHV